MSVSPAENPIETPLEAQCPRCGYDLHGLAQSWRESCPLTGRCSECGLDFHWGDLLNWKLNIPPWCIESPMLRGMLGWAWAMCRTLLMSFRPWRFWRELKMMHQPRWGRLAAYPLIAIPLLYLICTFAVGAVSYRIVRSATSIRYTSKYPPIVLGIKAAVLPLSSQPLWIGGGRSTRVGTTPRKIVSRYEWRQMGRMIVQAINHDFMFYPGRRELSQVRAFQALLLILLSPVGFLALPISRRVCKVRWRHVARIWIYSLPLIALPIGGEFGLQILSGTYWNSFGGKLLTGNLLLGITGLLLIFWWGFASQRYLKMQWPWLVAIAVVALPISVAMLLIEAYIMIVNGMG